MLLARGHLEPTRDSSEGAVYRQIVRKAVPPWLRLSTSERWQSHPVPPVTSTRWPYLNRSDSCAPIEALCLAKSHYRKPDYNSPSALFVFPPPSDTIIVSFPPKNAANNRNPPPQYALQSNRALRPAKIRRSHHVHLRPHRLRLRPYRQLPHLRLPGHSPPLPETPRLSPHPCNESHRRRRPHHRQRRRKTPQHPRLHRKIRASLLRRLQNAQHRIPRTLGTRHRQHRLHGPAHPAAPEKNVYVRERRLHLLPHRKIPRLRQALQDRCHRHPGRRSRRQRPLRKRERPRFRSLESPQARRAFLGHAYRPRPPRLAYRVLRHGHEISRRNHRHPY